MKKSLLAIAAMTAFAGAAQAQSSVTVYGIMDAGVASVSNGNKSTSAANNQVVGLQDGGLSSPRLGFMGTEDLGGGTKANFLLESELSLRNGGDNGISTNGNISGAAVGSQLFNRGAWVGLSDAKAGEVRLGFQNTITYDNAVEFDALKAANMGGFAAVGTNTVNGQATATKVYTTGVTGNATATGNLYSTYTTTRLSSSYAYITPTFAGFSAKVVQGQVVTTGADGVNAANTRDTEMGVRYVGHGATLAVNAATLANSSGSQLANQPATTGGTKALGAYGKYDFKILEVNAAYVKMTGQGTGGGNYTTTGIGIRAPLSAKFTVGIQNTMVNNSVVNNANANVAAGVVEYAMSKRTTLYALAAMSSNQSAGGTGFTSTSKFTTNAQPGTVGLNQSGYMIGMRHTF
jgi:predicted porin